MDIKIGDKFSRTRVVTDELIREFAEVSGDFNPIHLDDGFAEATQTMRLVAPVFIDDTITATGTVKANREEEGIVTLQTDCTNQNDEVTLKGEAIVMILSKS